jgi:hypothetical protein
MAAPAGHMLRSDDYVPDLEMGVDNNSGDRQFEYNYLKVKFIFDMR